MERAQDRLCSHVTRIPQQNDCSRSDCELTLIQVSYRQEEEEELCFFARVGFDSRMLNDLRKWRNGVNKLVNWNGLWVVSRVSYCVALIVIPKTILRASHNINVTVTTNTPEETTYWIDHRRGDVMRRVTPCGNLYQGNTGILAAGTCITLLGWRFATVSFPFARMTLDKMHLRLARKNSSIDEILYYSKDFRGILL
jgi:hypothetical protein